MARELPIFELPLVLLPGERVPLHIFEERYKRMVNDCLESGQPFGILLRDSGGARSTGCTASVTEVLERLDDGRLNVVVTGGSPFRVLDRFDDPQDPRAEVELVGEEDDRGVGEAAETARAAFLDLAELASGERPDPGSVAGQSAYGLAGKVELPAETKQQLLQMRAEEDRLLFLTEVLTGLRDALDRAEDVAERAQSNGRVRIRP